MINVQNRKNILRIIFLLLLFLLCLRIDYRFKYGVGCCSDDYDYYAHAETIAIDFDFDYSNQINKNHPYYYIFNDKIAPVGFPGSGILASPFLFFGNLFDEVFISPKNEILNYKLLFYSLSSIFYLLIGYFLIFKSLNYLDIFQSKYRLLLIIFGSGISYFAFERFSMTHAYEFFIFGFLIFHSIKFYKINNNYSAFMIPLIVATGYLVRMSNFYIFLIPLIIKLLVKSYFDIKNSLLKNKFFIFSSIFSYFIYKSISFAIYGRLIFDPRIIYGSNVQTKEVLFNNNSILQTLSNSIINMKTIIFGNEFGIFWVSPIIFVGFLVIYFNIYKENILLKLLLTICFMQNFVIVLFWKSTAASYGFRYLYSLIPISIIVFFDYLKRSKNILLYKYLIYMSIFATLSVIFFETTIQTQLSTDEVVNSFNEIRRYSEPHYVTGVLKSFFEINSYLIIFSTSFIGVIFFKTLLLFLSIDSLLGFLTLLKLPTENQDFINFLAIVENLSWLKIFIIVTYLTIFVYYIVIKLNTVKET